MRTKSNGFWMVGNGWGVALVLLPSHWSVAAPSATARIRTQLGWFVDDLEQDIEMPKNDVVFVCVGWIEMCWFHHFWLSCCIEIGGLAPGITLEFAFLVKSNLVGTRKNFGWTQMRIKTSNNHFCLPCNWMSQAISSFAGTGHGRQFGAPLGSTIIRHPPRKIVSDCWIWGVHQCPSSQLGWKTNKSLKPPK